LDPLLAPYEKRVRGFRAPYLSQNWDTWQAQLDQGLHYDAGEADTWSRTHLPHVIEGILQLPPTMPMDWTLLVHHGLAAEQAEALWVDKFEYVMARRGLFSWVHHPWIIEPHLDVVENLLALAMSRGDVWLARQDEVVDWWQRREFISLVPDASRPGRIEVVVNNAGGESIEGISVWIRAGEGNGEAWAASIDGEPAALVERVHAGARFRVVVVPELAAGAQRRVQFVTRDLIFGDRLEAATQ
ncbi:MAG: hypothetical protein ACOCSR_05485, partial [Wenzhouxiangella sp.]